MRADAAANRESLLAAARRLYAAHGGPAPMRNVAVEAGVGIGTLYRHFPTQQDLSMALIESIADNITSLCDDAVQKVAADPEAEWPAVVQRLVDLQLSAFMPAVAEQAARTTDDVIGSLPPAVREARERAEVSLASVVTQAAQAGLVPADLSPARLQLSLGILTRPLPLPELRDSLTPGLPSWLVEVFLDGLRAQARES